MTSVVTGSTGFLGGHLVKRLLRDHHRIVGLCRTIPSGPATETVTYSAVPLGDVALLTKAFEGADQVFHTAAKVGAWGEWNDFFAVNVRGTQNVIAACQNAGVRRLIYTSSPSVIFDGEAHRGVDESYPYPKRGLSFYSQSKREAEEAVLAASGSHLATLALRPHLIWGPGDRYLIPRVLEQARQGRLARVGNGDNLVDIVHVENAAEAHVLAAEHLAPGSACAGKAYFINQERPVALWAFIDTILRRQGLDPVKKAVSYPLARRLGWFLETVHRALRLKGEPRLSRFLAYSLAKDHYYSSHAAQRDFGYRPRVSIEAGLESLF